MGKPTQTSRWRLFLLIFTLANGTSCTRHQPEIWIYTSVYKEVLAEMTPLMKQAFPDVKIQWFQGGSENIAARMSAEFFAGNSRADLLLTSDPFWYLELKANDKLLSYNSPAVQSIPARYQDPDHQFVAVRFPVMVMGYHPHSQKVWPPKWKDLTDPRWTNQISMPNPLESGTSFTAMALLQKKYGWDYFTDLRKSNIMVSGGNSSVINRMETGERPIGIALLENIVKSKNKGSPLIPIYPADGVIPIPGLIAILKSTRNQELAKKVYDWFFSIPAQEAFTHALMYPAVPSVSGPISLPPWAELEKNALSWELPLLTEIFRSHQQLKEDFVDKVMQ